MADRSMIPATDGEAARQEILAALRRLDYEATESELVAATGIANTVVEEALRHLGKAFRCVQQVDAHSEVHYRFARGFESRAGRGAGSRKMLRRGGAGPVRFVRNTFKRLLLLPLMGYFALFVSLSLPPGLLVFTLVLACFWIAESLLRRDHGRSFYPRAAWVSAVPLPSRPVSHTIVSRRISGGRRIDGIRAVGEGLFAYLFARGRRNVSRWNKMDLLEVLDFLRRSRGMVSRAELMRLTGLTAGQAAGYASELLRAYRGEPLVTEGGSVVYRFEQLVATPAPRARPDHPAPIFYPESGEEIEKRFGSLITFMNGVNLFFGAFYSALVLGRLATIAGGGAPADRDASGVWRFLGGIHQLLVTGLHFVHPLAVAAVVLGIIPAGIASIYFALHIAAGRERARVRRTRQRRQLRKTVYTQVLSHPGSFDPARIDVGRPEGAETASREQVERIVDELAAAYGAEIEDSGEGHYVYRFPELEHEIHDLGSVRLAAHPTLLAPGSEDS